MPALPTDAAKALLDDAGARVILPLLNRDGGEARIVGGAVRNVLLGRPATDLDIATTLLPDEVMARAGKAGIKAVPTGIEHGTVMLVIGQHGYEVTTLRRDVETDGRRAVVAFTRDFAEDAARRDFTINQLSLSPDGEVHDHAGGLADLAAGRVRFIGDADQRIREDYLRILRFFRFSAEYSRGALDARGLAACAALKDGLKRLSRERVWSEVKKLLAAARAVEAMTSLIDRGIWGVICPLPADLATFTAATAIWPDADAMTRIASLSLRMTGDPDVIDTAFRLSAAERRRLEDAAAARARFLAGGPVDAQAVTAAGYRISAAGARDGLATLASGLNPRQAREFVAAPLPAAPWRGADVLALGVPPGPEVGTVLEYAEAMWEQAGFPQDRKTLAQFLERAVRMGRRAP